MDPWKTPAGKFVHESRSDLWSCKLPEYMCAFYFARKRGLSASFKDHLVSHFSLRLRLLFPLRHTLHLLHVVANFPQKQPTFFGFNTRYLRLLCLKAHFPLLITLRVLFAIVFNKKLKYTLLCSGFINLKHLLPFFVPTK